MPAHFPPAGEQANVITGLLCRCDGPPVIAGAHPSDTSPRPACNRPGGRPRLDPRHRGNPPLASGWGPTSNGRTSGWAGELWRRAGSRTRAAVATHIVGRFNDFRRWTRNLRARELPKIAEARVGDANRDLGLLEHSLWESPSHARRFEHTPRPRSERDPWECQVTVVQEVYQKLPSACERRVVEDGAAPGEARPWTGRVEGRQPRSPSQ